MERVPAVKRTVIWLVAVFGLVLGCSPAGAQTSINSVRINTEPAGLEFQVDGQTHSSAVDLLWPAASKHTILSYDQVQTGIRYTFLGIVTNLSPATNTGMPITADPALTWIKAVFKVEYALTLSLVDCPADVANCPGGARIQIGTALYDRLTVLWIAAGQQVQARAYPTDGYVFTGWSYVWELGMPTRYDITFPMLGPLVLVAYAQNANSVHATVNVVTDPPQLALLIDRTPYIAPIDLEWGWGTIHSIGTESVQLVRGAYYVFDSWSDGGALNHDVNVPAQRASISLVANFVPATAVSFGTTPGGLALTIDGASQLPNLTSYNFYWAQGSVHKISAPPTQTDAQGKKYRFVSWSNGQPADWTFTTGSTSPAGRIQALYQPVGMATVDTLPTGISVQVDGVACDTPCSLERDPGASLVVSVPAAYKTGERSRLAFQGWGDTSGPVRTIVLTADSKTYTAKYKVQNRLTVSAAPPEGASFTFDPQSTEGFYDAGSLVTVAAKVAAGFRVTAWSGDLSGASTTVALVLDDPKSALLSLDRVPVISPLGVRNAALGAPADRVAPGSLISIFGASLAPALDIGPPNPLAQTLASVTVRVDDTFLPLVFVSPSQINAQLPAATSEGTHKIIVRWEGRPETSAQILVQRNAPGLFGASAPDQPVGSFVRASGQAVTTDNPARAGELVTALGTGFGAYVLVPPDGFIFDETAGYIIADTVVLTVNDLTVAPLYTGRSGAAAGVDAVRFQVPASASASGFLTVKLRVGGQESNTMLLPVSR